MEKSRRFFRFVSLVWISCMLALSGHSQCPIPDFTVPASVCPAAQVTPTNATPSGYTYSWDVCTGELLNGTPTVTNLGSIPGATSAKNISIVHDGTQWLGFIKNSSGTNFVRLNFGNDLSNTPTDTTMTLNIPLFNSLGRIYFKQLGGNWYGLSALSGGGHRLVRLEFGNSLLNVPTVVDLGNFGGLLTNPSAVRVRHHGDTVFTLIPNFNNNNFTVLQQQGNILAPYDTSYNFTVPSLPLVNGATNMELIRDSCGWVGFVGMQFNSRIVRLEFGASLNNVPTFTDFLTVSSTVNTPVSLVPAEDQGNCLLFIRNRSSGITRVNFGNTYLNNPQGQLNFGNFGGVMTGNNDLLEYAKDGTKNYIFTGNGSFNLLRLDFADSCQNTPATASGFAPTFSILDSGTSVLSLTVTDSTGNRWYAAESMTQSANPQAQYAISNLCANQSTTFTDGSSISSGSITNWKWLFGDGDSATTTNANHVYANPGTYTTSLEVSSAAGCKDTVSQTVSVFASPVGAMVAGTACEGDTLPITNTSTISVGSIVSSTWITHLGDTFTQNVPPISYDTSGLFALTLAVVSDSGCTDTLINNVLSLARPDAQYVVGNGCEGDSTQFINTSTVASSTSLSSFSWELGDLSTSTAMSPVHLYADTGNYVVSMLVTAANGCADSITKDIRIANRPDPNFGFQPQLICEGDTFHFTDSTVTAIDTLTGWHWDFGNGDTSILQNPSNAFLSAGNFNVTLTATVGTGCDSSVTLPVEVRPLPVPNFTSSMRCIGGMTQFTDGSTVASGDSIVAWSWNLGNGSTDTVTDPVTTYNQSGSFDVAVEVTTALGCVNRDTLAIDIFGLPTVNFSSGTSCSGSPTNFFEQTTATLGDPIASWFWEFDNLVLGTSDTSLLQNPIIVFDTGVIHVVTLTVTSAEGCTNSITSNQAVSDAPEAGFTFSNACDGEATQFTNASVGSNLQYIWNFGNGSASTLPTPSHLYDSSGTYQVTLIARDAGSTCSDTTLSTVTVFNSPTAVIVNTNQSDPCIGLPFFLSDSSFVDGDTINEWMWTVFGGDTAMGPQVSFTFPDTNLQLIRLRVTSGNGCQDSVGINVQPRDVPTASFSFDPQFGVPPLDVNFSNSSIGATTYQWAFGDGGTSISAAPAYTYQDTGIYTISMTAISPFGCADSGSRTIKVIQPVLDIAVTDLQAEVQGNFYTLNAVLSNLGTRDITEVELLAKPDGSSLIRDSWTGFLPSGGTINYQFPASYSLVNGERPSFACLTAENPNGETDNVPDNDRDCLVESSVVSVVAPFPNPASDRITLTLVLPETIDVEVQVYDVMGRLVEILWDGNLPTGRSDINVPLEKYGTGFYQFVVNYRDQTEVLPFVKAE